MLYNGFLKMFFFFCCCAKIHPQKTTISDWVCVFLLGIFVCSQSGDHPYGEEEEDVEKCGIHPSEGLAKSN